MFHIDCAEEEYRTCYICKARWHRYEEEFHEMTLHDRQNEVPRWKCRVCAAAKMRGYYQTDGGREKVKASVRATRARRAGAPGRSATAAEIRDLFAVYGHRCQYPGCEETSGLELDHTVPLALGGRDEIAALQILCKRHNSQKGARFVSDYRPDGGRMARMIGVRGGKGLPLVSELKSELNVDEKGYF